MRALVIYESMFGNTGKLASAVADGVADGADVTLLNVVDAPVQIPGDVGLLVVGGPTHAFSMSRISTRRSAARRGGAYTDLPEGIREWLDGVKSAPSDCAFAAFDTRVDMPLLPGAASHAASRRARKLGFTVLEPASFLVKGYEGPLCPGSWSAHATGATA